MNAAASPAANGPQRRLAFKGVLDLPSAIEKFGRQMPKLAELDELVRQGQSSPHPELVARKRALPARAGTILAHPAQDSAFPRFFEFMDINTKRKICLDTRHYMGQRGIALVLEPLAYTFRLDGNRMIIIPSVDPILIPNFPQRPGWYPYDKDTGVPVTSGGVVDPHGSRPERFLQRTQDCWIGMPSRAINEGNHEEKYVQLFARPSLPQAVFIWETLLIQVPHGAGEDGGPRVPRRRVVAVPASSPLEKKEAPKSEPAKPKITYFQFKREWDIRRALHGLDPARCPDPGPVPDKEIFERLLREGKIRVEN